MDDFHLMLIHQDASLKDALLKMDAHGSGVLFVIDDQGRLRGSFSDGDARRAILKQAPMTEPVSTVMNPRPQVAAESSPRERSEAVMREYRIHHIPVVDREGRVTRILSHDDVREELGREREAVIMCGGLGTRLKHLTLHSPKPLLKVGGKPVLDTIIRRLRSFGVTRISLAINYLGHMIEEHLGDGSHLGVYITYLREQTRLGTAGALKLMEQRPNSPFLVVNGDVLSRINFGELLRYHGLRQAQFTASVVQRKFTIPYGVVKLDEGQMLGELQEKPEMSFFVNAGIYALSPECLDYVPENQFYNMTDLIGEVQRREQRVATFPIHEYWIDVGQPDDLGKANEDYDEVFAKEPASAWRVA